MMDYRQLIASDFKKTFKDYPSYGDIEISAARQVDSMLGPTILTCVRFDVRGRRRFYAYFIKNAAIAASRYSVQTDDCPAQGYEPFNVETGLEQPAAAISPGPLY